MSSISFLHEFLASNLSQKTSEQVGDNSRIAAGAVVLEAVPENSTAAGVPARIVRINGERVPLDQVHIPDPVSQELCRLTKRIEDLEKKVLENENL